MQVSKRGFCLCNGSVRKNSILRRREVIGLKLEEKLALRVRHNKVGKAREVER